MNSNDRVVPFSFSNVNLKKITRPGAQEPQRVNMFVAHDML
jgi:hypothetical protein